MIHAYQLHGRHIIIDVHSGSVHVVDSAACEAVVKYPAFDFTGAEDLRDEIQALVNQKKLFAPALEIPVKKSGNLKAMCLHVAHTCNLTCDYCFAQAGRYHGAAALMPLETGKRAIDFLAANAGGHRNLDVDFFGGEPLMNWPVVKALAAYARGLEHETGKRFRFTLTTNGLLLDDEVTAFCNREMQNVVLSLDGRREVHDRLRRTVDGRGSYDIVVPKFQKFVRQRGNRGCYIRGTFTHANPDFTRDLYHMADLGFQALSMEPVVCGPESPHALTKDDLQIVKQAYEALALEMARRRGAPDAFSFYHFNLDLARGPCIHKRAAGCGVGTDYVAVTPAGELYPCHQFVGEEQFRLGDVWQGITRPEIRAEFAACNLYSKPACGECWAKYYCAGGCPANAYHAGGSIHGVYEDGCELFRKRMECAIWLQTGGSGQGTGGRV